MNNSQRLMIWIAIMIPLMGLACFWSWQQMQKQQHIANLSANDQLQCQVIAQKIQALLDTAQTKHPDDDMSTLVQQIQTAAKLTPMPMNHLQRIRPSSPQRIGQSPYVETATQLSLNHITLKNAVTFLHHLANLPASPYIQSLRMTENRKNPAANTWQIEVGLATKVYAPQVRKKN